MHPILRGVLAVVAGFAVASAVMMAVEMINGHVLYPDLGRQAQGVTDPQIMRELLAGAPAGAFAVVLAGWFLGSFTGGWVAARIGNLTHALILGGLLTLAGIANTLMLPPPAWFWVAGMLTLMPAALAGAKLARTRVAG